MGTGLNQRVAPDTSTDMPTNSLRIARPVVTLRDQVVERLREAICDQRLPQGSRLVERQLCDMLGVSRTLVREALRQLEAEGFVVSTPHRGLSVASLDQATVRSIYEVRAVLEALAGSLFVERATDKDRQLLTAAIANYRRASEHDHGISRLHATARFYDVIFAGAQNEIISATLRPLSGRIFLLRARSMSMPGRREESAREMEEIFAAVLGNNPDDAWKACREHVERAAVYALRSLDPDAGAPPSAPPARSSSTRRAIR
jgi:DNA-binding GntR family transcriptional regulator